MHTSRARIGLIALAVLLLAAGAVSVTALRTHHLPSAGASAPAARDTPSPGPVRSPLLAELTGSPPLPTAAALASALTRTLTDAALGPTVAFSVIDVRSGAPLLEVAAATPVLPASTAKLLTAAAALSVMGPDRRFRTTVVAGRAPGDVVLTGGGDPTLAGPGPHSGTYPPPAQLRELAHQVRATGLVVRRVLVDDTLFTGPATGPSWRPDYVASGNVAPVSALEIDEGRSRPDRMAREADPALAAGRAFAGLL
nr:D-alanyl-D-alanine carboxypeptidase [Actinomycetota bacterium]